MPAEVSSAAASTCARVIHRRFGRRHAPLRESHRSNMNQGGTPLPPQGGLEDAVRQPSLLHTRARARGVGCWWLVLESLASSLNQGVPTPAQPCACKGSRARSTAGFLGVRGEANGGFALGQLSALAPAVAAMVVARSWAGWRWLPTVTLRAIGPVSSLLAESGDPDSGLLACVPLD